MTSKRAREWRSSVRERRTAALNQFWTLIAAPYGDYGVLVPYVGKRTAPVVCPDAHDSGRRQQSPQSTAVRSTARNGYPFGERAQVLFPAAPTAGGCLIKYLFLHVFMNRPEDNAEPRYAIASKELPGIEGEL